MSHQETTNGAGNQVDLEALATTRVEISQARDGMQAVIGMEIGKGAGRFAMMEVPASRVAEIESLFASVLSDAARLSNERLLAAKREELAQLEAELAADDA
jgi:hypothetical protein